MFEAPFPEIQITLPERVEITKAFGWETELQAYIAKIMYLKFTIEI